jgi:hypothetical protein
VIIAQEVYAQAKTAYPTVGARELGLAYARWLETNQRTANRSVLMPPPVANLTVATVLGPAIRSVGPEPDQVLRLRFHDPQCGVGITLTTAAGQLSRLYAIRLINTEPPPEVIDALLPYTILHCIYGTDPDPIAVELAKLALSLQTGGLLPTHALDRHIIRGDAAETGRPPAMNDRPDGVDVLKGTHPATPC